MQEFQNPDGVQGRAFAEFVTASEWFDAAAVGLTNILADAADEDIVASRSLRQLHNFHDRSRPLRRYPIG